MSPMPSWTLNPPQQGFTNALGILSTDDVLGMGASESRFWELGGKAWGLLGLVEQGFPVPPFFVVSHKLFWSAIPASQAIQWQENPLNEKDIEDIQHAIQSREWGYSIQEKISGLLSDICPDQRPVAVRSSALHEDSASESYAGLYESELCVPHELVLQAVKTVWLSAISESLQAYLKAKDKTFTLQIPSIVIQRNVDAEISGVTFSAEPITGQRGVAVVSAVHGLGSVLVSGEAEAQTYYVGTKNPLPPFEPEYILACQEPTAPQSVVHRWGEEGVAVSHLKPEETPEPVLTTALAKNIAALAWDCESSHHGVPQDVEWAIEGDKLWVLQSRPITTEDASDANRRIDYTSWPVVSQWVRDTAQETWPEPVKPATIAFARRWVAATHRVLATHACVSKIPESEYDWMFPELIGSVGSYLYQHQSLMDDFWKKAPSLTFTFKRCQAILGRWIPILRFDTDSPYAVLYTGQGGLDSIGLLLKSAFGWASKIVLLMGAVYTIPERQKAFTERMAQLEMNFEANPIQNLSEGVVRIQQLDGMWGQWADVSALTNYWATCLSDTLDAFYPQKTSAESERHSWRDADLLNDKMNHLQAEGIPSSSTWKGKWPTHSFYEEWTRARQKTVLSFSPAIQEILKDKNITDEACWEAIQKESQTSFEIYCKEFGLRCSGEVTIESPVLKEKPLEWVQLLRISAVTCKNEEEATQNKERCKRSVPFLWRGVVQYAQRWLQVREYVRYAMSRWANLYRLTVNDISKDLVASGVLESREDAHFLLFEELEQLCVGSLTAHVAQSRVKVRRALFAMDTQPEQLKQPPPRVCQSFGRYVSPAMQPVENLLSERELEERIEMTGRPVCEGAVTAPVLVWESLENPPLKDCEGKILIVRQGSPALVGVYGVVAGLLFEVGSALSHPAIVARELGVPTITGVSQATQWLKSGQVVSIDGLSGKVVKRSEAL